MLVREILDNTYICSSDNYFEENPSKAMCGKHITLQSTLRASQRNGASKPDRMTESQRITVGGTDAWYMIGHVFFDRAFSAHFREILEAEYDLPQTRDKLWEDLVRLSISKSSICKPRYDQPIIHEFDFAR